MRKPIAVLLLLFLLAVVVRPGRVHAEEIVSFHAVLAVGSDGGVAVTERIVYDFGSTPKHGIIRTIPFVKTTVDGKRMKMAFGPFTVTDQEAVPYRFSVTGDGAASTLKIGDPDKTVTGRRTYLISYRAKGALTYFSDHDELYWNVNGTDWQVPVRSVTAEVRLPVLTPIGNVRLACYTGAIGSQDSACTTAYSAPTARFSTLAGLGIQENMTVSFGFPKGIAAVLEPEPLVGPIASVGLAILSVLAAVGAVVWYIVLPIWIVVRWFKAGRDPKPTVGVTSAWFDVPKTADLRPLTPGETGTLIDERAQTRDVIATVVDLARRGWWRIVEKTKGDFSLVRSARKDTADELLPHERALYDGMLSGKDELRIRGSDLSEPVAKATKTLYERVVAERFFTENPDTVRTRYGILGGLGLFTLNVPLAAAAFLFGMHMPKKTPLGADTAAIAMSLRNFITKEHRHFRFQAKNQILFEKFLPYAIAFGVERIWADRFSDIAVRQPDWYSGYGRGRFDSVIMVRSLDTAFLRGFAAAATPTRSSSGFSSGFSGGHSGGGGGGGGGRSW